MAYLIFERYFPIFFLQLVKFFLSKIIMLSDINDIITVICEVVDNLLEKKTSKY